MGWGREMFQAEREWLPQFTGKELRAVDEINVPEGTVAVVEFHKVDGPPGPPRSWRLAPVELELLLAPFGFRSTACVDVGPANYLSLFTLWS